MEWSDTNAEAHKWRSRISHFHDSHWIELCQRNVEMTSVIWNDSVAVFCRTTRQVRCTLLFHEHRIYLYTNMVKIGNIKKKKEQSNVLNVFVCVCVEIVWMQLGRLEYSCTTQLWILLQRAHQIWWLAQSSINAISDKTWLEIPNELPTWHNKYQTLTKRWMRSGRVVATSKRFHSREKLHSFIPLLRPVFYRLPVAIHLLFMKSAKYLITNESSERNSLLQLNLQNNILLKEFANKHFKSANILTFASFWWWI